LQADKEELAYWLWLSGIRFIGPSLFAALIREFDNPWAVYEADAAQVAQYIEQIPGIKGELKKKAIASLRGDSRANISRASEMARRQLELAEKFGCSILTLSDARYPKQLRQQENAAPPILWAKGILPIPGGRAAAIVGTRKPSPEGREEARLLASRLCQDKWLIVSGLALGIDRAGHEGALESDGFTIGVLGCGLDRVYPPENKDLIERLFESGLVVSEFPIGTAISQDNLRKRNKTIVGLSEYVIVGECPYGGGALNAAKAANDQKKPLYVMFGNNSAREQVGGDLLLLAKGKASKLPPDEEPDAFIVSARLPEKRSLTVTLEKYAAAEKTRATKKQLSGVGEKAWKTAFEKELEEVPKDLKFGKAVEQVIDRVLIRDTYERGRLKGQIEAVLFDLDGVLVDISSSIAECAKRISKEYEVREKDVTIYSSLGLKGMAEWVAEEDSYACYKRSREVFELAYGQQASLYEPVIAVIRRLRERGIKMGVVTSQSRTRAHRVLGAAVDDLDVVVVYGDTNRHKPDPEPILYALDKLGVAPDEALLVGDTLEDTKAGKAAGTHNAVSLWGSEINPLLLASDVGMFLCQPDELLDLLG